MATVQGFTASPQGASPEQLAAIQRAMEMGAPGVGQQVAPGVGQMASPAMMLTAQPSGPPTGLIGSEQALMGGSSAALDALMQGFGRAEGALQPVGPADMSGVRSSIASGLEGVGGTLQPWQTSGLKAFDMQAALSGALGADAQAQAYRNFQSSPGQQFLRDRAEQALLRNAAALGGLGGGRVRQELQRQAIGEASQDFNNAFNRIGTVAQGGLQAAGQEAGLIGALRGQEAGIAGNLESQRMGLTSAQNQALAQIAANTGANAAQIAAQTGRQVAADRLSTGRDIAGAVGGTTSALANLVNQQGQDIASGIGTGAGDLANIIAGAGGAQAGSQQNLATILANIATGQGSNVTGLPGLPEVQNTDGIIGNIGNLLSGVGAVV